MDIRRRMLTSSGEGMSGEGINVDNYLTIEANEDGLTAKLSVNACEYCVDGDGNWKTLSAGTATESINSGHTLSFRGNLTPNSSKGIGTFTINKKCNLKGNCMSMLFGDNAANNYSLSGKSYAFYNLFYGCSNIVNVSSNFLPATTLANYCYQYMFYNCRSLTTAPELPATTLAANCYHSMFYGCRSLTTAPELPATTLANYCYYSMFYGTNVLPDCSNIDFASSTVVASGGLIGLFSGTKVTDNDLERLLPKNDDGKYYLPATTLANYCYHSMFIDCTSLTTAPELPATTLASSCYQYMFYGCSSLTTAPELPATTLANYCYQYMFYNCSRLTTAPNLPATTLASYCYNNMFYNCSSLTTAPNLPATTLATYCYYAMFRGCKNLTTAPNLPATTLASYCYSYMFYGCSRLTTAPNLPATTLASNCYYTMFRGCTNLTTAPELPATTLENNCYQNMFYGCTSLTTAPELSATTLASYCYSYMFYGCKKLNYIKMLATDISASNCLNNWVKDVSSTGTFVKNASMTSLPTGTSGIPSGWTVQNA